MEKSYLLYPKYLLFLFASILLASCKGQADSSKESAKQSSGLVIGPIENPQIAEYIVEIYEDKKNQLWFGTMAKGAARFDGDTLKYFTTEDGLCGNTVLSITEDQKGNLWFGTHTGVSIYDGKQFSSVKGVHGAGCNILVDKKGKVWAATNDGVFRYNGTAFIEFDIPKPTIPMLSYKWEAGKVWSMMEDRKGNIWFAIDGYGVCKYDGKSFVNFTKEDGLCSNNVTSIREDKAGHIWIASISSDFPEYKNEGGLCRYDGNRFTRFPELDGLTKNDVYTIGEDKKGNIWIGAIGHGAYRYNGEKFHLFQQTNRPDLSRNFAVQAILEDSKGTLWFGFSGGLFRFVGDSFINETKAYILMKDKDSKC